MAIIQEDSRQQMNKKHHEAKRKYFESRGHKVVRSKMLVGDYCVPSNGSVVVDSKQHCSELYQDLIQDHARFHNECILAKQCGIKLYIVIESQDGFTSIEDFKKWKNPQMIRYYRARKHAMAIGGKIPKPPATNIQLVKIMNSMNRDYGVEFIFVPYKDAGAKILELLGVKENEKTD